MALIPAVYITVEDRSFVDTPATGGRNIFMVVLSDRGPNNKVIQIDTQNKFVRYFGEPNIEKTGQMHYMAIKALSRTSRLFVVRPTIINSDDPEVNSTIANTLIKYNSANGSTQPFSGKYNFINVTDATNEGFSDPTEEAKTIIVNKVAFNSFDIGDLIFSGNDSESEIVTITEKIYDELNNIYSFKLSNSYTGTSTVITSTTNIGRDPINGVDVDGWDFTSYKYYPGSEVVSGFSYEFTNGSNVVLATDISSYNAINVEDYIYPDSSSSLEAVQVIKKEIVGTDHRLIIEKSYTGTSTVGFVIIRKYNPLEVTSLKNLKTSSEIDVSDSDNIYYLYALGTGSYYNNIFVTGVRNILFEKAYLEEDGETNNYKYNFLDITIYQRNPDGTAKILEGPWTVSMVNKTLSGTRIIDFNTGRDLFIETVINERSEYINIKVGLGLEELLGNPGSENLRLQLLAKFSSGNVFKLPTRGYEGFYLKDGSDGILYDEFGRLNITNNEIISMVSRCYNGTFESEDGSVESMLQVLYPTYQFDYVIAGGYPVEVQNAALELVEARQDCLLLADPGNGYNSADDINTRRNDMNWNSYNAMLYTQFRQFKDTFSGKTITMSPVYHAMENHLKIDGEYFLSEPVAGIGKTLINESIKLEYKPTLTQIEDMMNVELNATITEPDGTYLITQFTTYKKLSVLKRAHAIKFVHYIRKNLPSRLKDILQRKGSIDWSNEAKKRIDSFMNPYVSGNGGNINLISLSEYSSQVSFDEIASSLNIVISIKPLRAIETINVSIIVR